MKIPLLLIALACFWFPSASAQTGKGNFIIGGSMNFLHDKRDDLPQSVGGIVSPNSNLSISPTVGYFVGNNFLIGVQTTISLGWNSDYSAAKDNVFSAGPMVRYYFPFGKFAVFPELATGYNSQSTRYALVGSSSGSSTLVHTKYVSSRAGAGIAWFAAPNIGIEGIIAYKQNTFSSKNELSRGSESWFYFNVGLQFYLNRNK